MSALILPYSYQVSTGEQCRQSDRDTIEQFGIDSFTLMETAGLQAARIVNQKTDPGATGLFVCGKGNNGGDALVVARYLSIHHHHTCHLLYPAGHEKLSTDSQKNMELLQKLQEAGKPVIIHESEDLSAIPDVDYVIDGLLGTGLSTAVRSPLDTAIEKINRRRCPVYAIDIPSGLHSDSGKPMNVAVKADSTLSFGALKTGFYLHEGPGHTGEVIPLNLTFPEHLRGSVASLISPELDTVIPPIRRKAEHKYSDHVLYVVAGSEGLTGAAIMSASSGWNTGAGAVILVTPKGLLDIYERNLPGIIKSPVGKRNDYFFKKRHADDVLNIISQKEGSLLIGPGLGQNNETKRFIRNILEKFGGRSVIDADALQSVKETVPPESATWILTPHPGEMRRISGSAFSDDLERINWTAAYSKKHSIYVVSKGNPTFVGTPDGRNYITGYDTRIFARAGFGDVLSGAIAGNLAITEHSELSIVRALLDGYLKADRLRRTLYRPLEPNDLL